MTDAEFFLKIAISYLKKGWTCLAIGLPSMILLPTFQRELLTTPHKDCEQLQQKKTQRKGIPHKT
jgi:hypothetical protein